MFELSFAISGRCVVKSLAEQLAHACQNSRNAFGINRMDAIGHGFLLLPHTSLLRSKQPNTLRKFAEFNYPPLPGLSNRRTVPKCPKRLQMTLGMANFSSIDIPRKGKSNNETRTLKDSFGKPKLQRGASHEGKDLTEAPADSSKHSRDAPVVTLDKSATVGPGMHHKKTSLSWSGKHSGQLVWKELQELVKRDTGPPSWYCYEDAGSRPENAPLFFCLPGMPSSLFPPSDFQAPGIIHFLFYCHEGAKFDVLRRSFTLHLLQISFPMAWAWHYTKRSLHG